MVIERKLVYSSAINKNILHSMEHIQENVTSEDGNITLVPYFPKIFASNVCEYDIADSYIEFCLPYAINKVLQWKNDTFEDCNLSDLITKINSIVRYGSINTYFDIYTHFPPNEIEELNGNSKLESMNHGLSSGAVLLGMLYSGDIGSDVDDFYFTENIGMLNSYFANTFLMLRRHGVSDLLPAIPYIENEIYLGIAGEFFDNFVNEFDLDEIKTCFWYIENEVFKKASTYEYIMSVCKLIDA